MLRYSICSIELAICFEAEAAWSCGDEAENHAPPQLQQTVGYVQDLQPSVYIHKRFGKEITVRYYVNRHSTNRSLSIMEETKAFIGRAEYTRANWSQSHKANLVYSSRFIMWYPNLVFITGESCPF